MGGIAADLFLIEAIDPRAQLANYDLVVLNRVPFPDALADVIRVTRAAGGTFVFDVDDLIFDESALKGLAFVDARGEEVRARFYNIARDIRRTMDLCSHVLCYTSGLEAEVAKRGYRPVRINICASQEMVEHSEAARTSVVKDPGFVTVGYAAGHAGHTFSFRVVEGVLLDLLRSYPCMRLAAIGPFEISSAFDRFGDRVLRVPPVDWRLLPLEIARLDIAIAPLEDHSFNQCKSHLKYIDTALCGVPLVASRVGQHAETIRDGQTGFLAGSPGQWRNRLEMLIGDRLLRRTIGEKARQDVLEHWTTRAQAGYLRGALERILRETYSGPRTRWWQRLSG